MARLTTTELLSRVWDECTFDEIIDAGFEQNACNGAMLLQAASDFNNPNQEFSDDEIKDIIKDRGLRDIMGLIQNEYSLDEILDELPNDEILDNISEDERLESLEHSWALERHDDEIRDTQYREYIDEWIEELRANEKEELEKLQDASSDDLRQFFCNLFGIGYYDEDGLFNGFRNLFDKLEKSTYKDKRELKWLLTKE